MHGLRTPADAHPHQPVGLERQPARGVPRRCDEVAHGETQPGAPNVGQSRPGRHRTSSRRRDRGRRPHPEPRSLPSTRTRRNPRAEPRTSRSVPPTTMASPIDCASVTPRFHVVDGPTDEPGIRILSDDIRRACSGRHAQARFAGGSSSRPAPGAPPRTPSCGCATGKDPSAVSGVALARFVLLQPAEPQGEVENRNRGQFPPGSSRWPWRRRRQPRRPRPCPARACRPSRTPALRQERRNQRTHTRRREEAGHGGKGGFSAWECDGGFYSGQTETSRATSTYHWNNCWRRPENVCRLHQPASRRAP